MDLTSPHSDPATAGDSGPPYQSHGFTPTTSMGAAETAFDSEQTQQQQQQQYDADNAQSDDHDVGLQDQEEEALPEIETAYSEARARGLPDGWTCSIDVCVFYAVTLICSVPILLETC